jgi:glycosyltransferase involved in cell wall biosynthesis
MDTAQMMKDINIAIVSTNRNKYSETFILQHVQRLAGKVHFLFDGYFPAQYSVDKGVTAKRFSNDRRSFFGRLFLKKKEESEEIKRSVEEYLAKNNVRLLFCEYGPSGVAMMELARKLNIPLLVHFHGYDAYRNDILETYGRHYPLLFEVAQAVVCVSNHMVEQLRGLGCPASKLHFIPYGIDLSVFRIDPEVKKDITFVACGRFVEKKAPSITIKAFAKVLSKMPEATLVMIGDGELLEYCKVLTAKLGIKHAVEFMGVLAPEQVAATFRRARVFVQHSITTKQNDQEGTPLSLLESAACGLPAVGTRHGGFLDVIREGETGFLVNEMDVDAMAEAMLAAARPVVATVMGGEAAKLIERYYNIDLNIIKLQEIIDACLLKK